MTAGEPVGAKLAVQDIFTLSAVEHFVGDLPARQVTPHIAINGAVSKTGKVRKTAIDGRTLRHADYAVSLRCRKRIEEAFGWIKANAGLRKVKLRGRSRSRRCSPSRRPPTSLSPSQADRTAYRLTGEPSAWGEVPGSPADDPPTAPLPNNENLLRHDKPRILQKAAKANPDEVAINSSKE